jgi:large subunit ribosomal protein L33
VASFFLSRFTRRTDPMTATRIQIALACSVCGNRNYRTTKAVRAGEPAFEQKKFCKTCNLHTLHKETK